MPHLYGRFQVLRLSVVREKKISNGSQRGLETSQFEAGSRRGLMACVFFTNAFFTMLQEMMPVETCATK
jgi:hypothetical protein